MKKILFNSFCLIAISSILIIGCRKKETAAQQLATKPKHCYNNIQDDDETTVDAGGSCGSNGGSVTSSCSVGNDTAVIGSTNHIVTSCHRTTNGNSEPVFTLQMSGGWSIVITCNASLPYNYVLSPVTSGPSQFEYVGVVNDPVNGPLNLTYGDVIIKTNGTDYAVDLCNGAYYPPGGPYSVTAFAKVN